jgi:hypothetical protein
MKLVKFFVLLLATAIAPSLYGQKSKPFSFTGAWANTQLEEFTNKKKDLRFLTNISPQYLIIDSAFKLTIIFRIERKGEYGKPVSKRNFGPNVQELTYKKKFEIYLTQAPEDPNYIVMTFENSSAGIIFKRQD